VHFRLEKRFSDFQRVGFLHLISIQLKREAKKRYLFALWLSKLSKCELSCVKRSETTRLKNKPKDRSTSRFCIGLIASQGALQLDNAACGILARERALQRVTKSRAASISQMVRISNGFQRTLGYAQAELLSCF
jgi:hypothetical protein